MTKKSRVAVTPQLREELRSESNRTTIGPMKLFRGRRHELPTGLNSRVVNSWLDGSAQSAKPEHIQYVLNSYKNYPLDEHHRELDSEMRQKIASERLRTNVSYAQLISESQKPPSGLTAKNIIGWVRGSISKVLGEHHDFVLLEYDKRVTQVPISNNVLDRLRSARYRTGVNLPKLFKRHPQLVPTDLSIETARKILAGTKTQADKRHIDFLLSTYSETPDKRRGRS